MNTKELKFEVEVPERTEGETSKACQLGARVDLIGMELIDVLVDGIESLEKSS
jgi:hypothetical protein